MELQLQEAADEYWRIQVLKPKLVPASWEEKAFAEDTSGPLGGCIWPPRCYSCSFCRKEFKSAQALGGHMNVHRRDRARLKQSLMGSASDHENDCKSLLGSSTIHHHHHPHHPHHQLIVSSSPSVITTASAVSTNSRVSAASYNFNQEQSDNYSISPKLLGHVVNLKSDQVEKKHKGSSDSVVGTDLCVGMNSNINEARTSTGKRAKIDNGVSSFSSFLVKELSSSSSSCANQEMGLLNSGSNIAELDLELRLGNRPVPKLSWV